MKKTLTIAIALIACLSLSVPAMACWGPDCADNVEAHMSAEFGAYDSADLNRDNGRQGASAFADGFGGGSFEANSYGDKMAHVSGIGPNGLAGFGAVDPTVGASRTRHSVTVGASAGAGSWSGVHAKNDGGIRDASVEVYGSVYQSNGAFTNDGPGNFAAGGNYSGANYANSDSASYDGSTHTTYEYMGNIYGWGRLNPWNYRQTTTTICYPGEVVAETSGGAFTAGGTFVYSKATRNQATSFGATGSYSIGNDGVFGSGSMETGTFVSRGNSGGSAYTSGSYNYSGNGFGAGATFGGSHVRIGKGTVSVSASHTSIATGNTGQQPD